MPTTESTIAETDSPVESPPVEAGQQSDPKASKPLKNLLVGFAATVTIGLGLALWYLTNRIVKAGEVTPSAPSRVVVTNVGEARAAVVPSQPAVQEQSIADTYRYAVSPAPAPLYLQLASLGPKEDAKFVKRLRAKGFQAEIHSRVNEDTRLLVGPFFSHAELDRAKAKLERAGVLAIEDNNVLDR